jgi:hypothetical protein
MLKATLMSSKVSYGDKILIRNAMKQAVEKTIVLATDSDRDILGKVFNHFKQSLQGSRLEGWELARSGFKRLKNFSVHSSTDLDSYVGNMLAAAFLEVKNKNYDDYLNSMKAILVVAKKVNNKSDAVVNRICDIERELNV